MLTRILTAVVAVAIMIPILYYSATPVFTVFLCFISAIAVYEMLGVLGTRKKWFVSVPMMLAGICFPAYARHGGGTDRFFRFVFLISLVIIIWNLSCATFSRGRISLESVALTATMTIYITFGISSIALLRDMGNGKYVYLLAFLLPWMSDTFAYFIGVLFGKHKLIPDVSPKKSVEGCIAGIIGSGLSAVVYGVIVNGIYHINATHLELFAVGMIVSVLAQIGDLIASVIKRRFNVKDYGKILPGHGGIMDRFDSILLAAPALYFALDLFHPFI